MIYQDDDIFARGLVGKGFEAVLELLRVLIKNTMQVVRSGYRERLWACY